MNPLETYNPDFSLSIDDYAPVIGDRIVGQLKQLAQPLAGKRWTSLNSTLAGGGVAEMLQRMIPLARSLGIDAEWQIIRGNDQFFSVTKKFHNLLQGVQQPISLEELYEVYIPTIENNAADTFIAADLIVVHDPQPIALIQHGRLFGNVLWRCHIDTSQPNPLLWRFILPFINQYSGAIFTAPDFVGTGVHVPTYQIFPSLDPLAPKNHQYSRVEALDLLQPLLLKHQIDPERPILAAISRYDVHKNQISIIQAFKKIRAQKSLDPAPYLIFLGNTASDDPEGGAMLAQLQAEAGSDPDIRFLVNVADNDRVVGSLMSIARAFVHISTREGFGLVVSEALWQGTPVIGSRVGGIPAQVVDGRNGYLVEPHDIEHIAANMIHLLEHPEVAAEMGREARHHVRQNFLLPELVRRYLLLMRYYTGVDSDAPDFRLDEIAYSELRSFIRTPNNFKLTKRKQTKNINL